jgi:hypothetical protein
VYASAAQVASMGRLSDFRCLRRDVLPLQCAKKCLRFLKTDADIAGRSGIAAATDYQYWMFTRHSTSIGKLHRH